jgi:hypothetical protein
MLHVQTFVPAVTEMTTSLDQPITVITDTVECTPPKLSGPVQPTQAEKILFNALPVPLDPGNKYHIPRAWNMQHVKRIYAEYVYYYREQICHITPDVHAKALQYIKHHGAIPDGFGEASKHGRFYHIEPNPYDFMSWRVWIGGAAGSLFQGAVLQFHIQFCVGYPFKPFTLTLIRRGEPISSKAIAACKYSSADRTAGNIVPIDCLTSGGPARTAQQTTPYANEAGHTWCCWNREGGFNPAMTVANIVRLAAAPMMEGTRTVDVIDGNSSIGHEWFDTNLCVCKLPAEISKQTVPKVQHWIHEYGQDSKSYSRR